MPVMRGTLSRRVLASKAPGGSITKIRHLDKGTAIEVIRQRNDSRVEVLLAADRASGSWLVPADAIDAITARAMGIQRPPRNRRTSGAVPPPTSRYQKGPGSH